MVSIAVGGVDVVENGSLRADGSLYSQGNILADGQSTLDILGKVCTKQTISIQNGSSAAFSGNLVCRSLSVSGSSGSNIVCLSDVYAYNTIEAHGPENMIDIKGKLYIAPDIVSPSSGVIAQDSGKIMLEDDIFIDGTLDCSDLVITEGQVTMKSSLQQPDLFFQKVLADMEKQASWNYRNQLIPSVSVPDCNVFPEGSSFTIENSDSPIVYILPDQEDINLPSGEYSGILMTDGSIRVNKGDNVVFTGLLIAGGKLIVEGNLTVKEDKKLLLRLLDVQGEPLMSFFRISREKPLVEIQSCREHLYNEKIGG
jgi:cytoskeletal protein CcmA (bactofilin family)